MFRDSLFFDRERESALAHLVDFAPELFPGLDAHALLIFLRNVNEFADE
jgi:hypothetical protein